MGSSDGSPEKEAAMMNGGHNDSTQQLSEKSHTKPRKKKSNRRRRSSEGDISDASQTDASESSRAGGPTKQKTRRKKKRAPRDAAGGGMAVQDSMLIAIKNKRKEQTNGEGGPGNGKSSAATRKRVSLSGSTIQRDVRKLQQKGVRGNRTMSDLDVAMGKMPPADAAAAAISFDSRGVERRPSDDVNMNDDGDESSVDLIDFDRSERSLTPSVRSHDTEKSAGTSKSVDTERSGPSEGSATRRGSALKPSKYGRNAAGGAPAGSPEGGPPEAPAFEPFDLLGSDGDGDSDEDAPLIAHRIRRAPRTESVGSGSTDDGDDDSSMKYRPQRNPKRGGARKHAQSVERESSWKPGGLGSHSQSERSESSWKPEGLPLKGLRRARTEPADDEEEETKPPSRHARFSDSVQDSLTIPGARRGRMDRDNDVQGSFRRPGIKKRGSMNLGSRSRLAGGFDVPGDPESESERTGPGGGGGAPHAGERQGMMESLRQKTFINKKSELRRVEMSVRDQTYIPPKSREANLLEAMGHLAAGRVIDLTLWTYSAGFLKVMLFFLAFYIVNIFVWAAVMDVVDVGSGGKCIHDDALLMTKGERYEFLVELSWATFTTVGYGTISPKGDVTGCYAIRFCCAFVAFIGVLFASTTAAIMYSKLMRLLAKAHVTFSSTLCVQYGKGNEGSTVRFGQLNFRASVAPAALMKQFSASDLLDVDGDNESPSGSEDGFPVIEFRMINDRANHEGSEIWDAQIRGIVQLHKEMSSDGSGRSSARDKATGGESTLDLEKKVYYPVSLSPDMHPHFSRIWYARHVLNAESPLLKREMRDEIVKDGGKWDKDFNNWEEIRKCLNEFISLRITLSGTSAVSASDIYGEHVYYFDDVCVGWRFANMVYEQKERPYHKSWWRKLKEDEKEDHSNAETKTKIDAALLHDIVPQPGGDHEPLNETNSIAGKWLKFT